jgi:hypothetical protein
MSKNFEAEASRLELLAVSYKLLAVADVQAVNL